ncbi:MAG: peptidogalycan biosysnthesis protein [Wenzhouxiangellaceae bacterium]|nr:peptidogalycan biosysnthesis protein [Wenzhouxiangellaceae bacterium]
MQSDSSTSPEGGGSARSLARDIPRAEWNALNRNENPFTDHRFLAALETAGCVGAETGWDPLPLSEAGGFAPAWRKHHSHGEFVFDFAWAEAAHRAGLRWFPKLLVAAPYSPVTGPRLLGDAKARVALVEALERRVAAEGSGVASVNFCDAVDRETLTEAEWLSRWDWQYHWHNHGYRDFEDFLDRLRSKPRKNIRRERRLAHSGWSYRWIDGEHATEAELDLLTHCYRITFLQYRNMPALNRAFFGQAARLFGDRFLACIASRDGEDRAASVFWKSPTRLYGRYWGALDDSRDVHFEACYYQGIERCIADGLEVFEPGAQGEHKIRRGFTPIATHSFHHVAHPGLREGIRRWLQQEDRVLRDLQPELERLLPYGDRAETRRR